MMNPNINTKHTVAAKGLKLLKIEEVKFKRDQLKQVLVIGVVILGVSFAPIKGHAQEIFVLQEQFSVCKVNCTQFTAKNCENKNEREVISLPIKDANKLTVSGRGLAEAQSDNSPGRVTMVFEGEDGKILEREQVIPAKSSKTFSVKMPLAKKQSGSLTIHLRVSDWCTSLERLKVVQE
ncbi:MAG: hypothetical protein HQL65_09350 [Magnetococcales bacterium]|nr:hypothetical protein [Magnetococcales bacterium]